MITLRAAKAPIPQGLFSAALGIQDVFKRVCIQTAAAAFFIPVFTASTACCALFLTSAASACIGKFLKQLANLSLSPGQFFRRHPAAIFT